MRNHMRVAATSLAALALALGPAAPGTVRADARAAGGRLPDASRPWHAGTGAQRPLEVAVQPGAGSVNSLNSAGYAVTRDRARLASIRATFFVPYLDCALSKGAYSQQWIGLDGLVGKPDSVEQDGIEADCSAAGRSSFRAWHAMYPRRRVVSGLSIRSGDSVTASVSYDPADARFALTLTDNTTGGRFRVHARCPRRVRCPRSSAEVISSAPTTGSDGRPAIRPLADYGAVSFAGISVTNQAGQRGGLRSPHWSTTRIIQTRPAAPFELIARPTPIEADAFDNYWARER